MKYYVIERNNVKIADEADYLNSTYGIYESNAIYAYDENYESVCYVSKIDHSLTLAGRIKNLSAFITFIAWISEELGLYGE